MSIVLKLKRIHRAIKAFGMGFHDQRWVEPNQNQTAAPIGQWDDQKYLETLKEILRDIHGTSRDIQQELAYYLKEKKGLEDYLRNKGIEDPIEQMRQDLIRFQDRN